MVQLGTSDLQPTQGGSLYLGWWLFSYEENDIGEGIMDFFIHFIDTKNGQCSEKHEAHSSAGFIKVTNTVLRWTSNNYLYNVSNTYVSNLDVSKLLLLANINES